MEMIVNLVTWVTIIVTVASLIAASTPTPKDDEIYAKFYKVIEMIAGIVTKVAKK